MTIEEKLQHFYDTSMEEARNQASQELSAHQNKLNEMLSEHKKARTQDARAQIDAETQNARREINKALSARQLTLKRSWNTKQNELKDKLFAEVKERLDQFMSTPEYESYLCRKVRDAADFAGEDEMIIYLSPEDLAHQQSVTEKTGLPVQISEEPFTGGIRAVIPAKNILIDNSFAGAYQRLHKEFQFDGGLCHE